MGGGDVGEELRGMGVLGSWFLGWSCNCIWSAPTERFTFGFGIRLVSCFQGFVLGCRVVHSGSVIMEGTWLDETLDFVDLLRYIHFGRATRGVIFGLAALG